MSDTSEINTFLSNVNDCLLISGSFSDSLTVPIISYVNDIQIDNKKSGKKLSFLVAESFQNIVRHGYEENSEDNSQKLKEGFFAMLKLNKEIIISSTNTIEKSKVSKLDTELKRLGAFDQAELKNEFINVLKESKTTEGGGAGLGLIEIMRKTGSRFNHSFLPKDDKLSFVNFDIFFNAEKEREQIEFNSTMLRNLFLNENVVFLRKGLFNHESFIQLSNVLQQKSKDEKQQNKKILFYVFVELIQNIYKHGAPNEDGDVPGLFYVQDFPDHMLFNSQNLSPLNQANETKNRIDKLNQLSSEELLLLYKERMLQQISFEEGISGDIGLIEIVKETKNPIVCTIIPFENDTCYLSITVKINS